MTSGAGANFDWRGWILLLTSLCLTACVGPDIPRLSDPSAVQLQRIQGLNVAIADAAESPRLLWLHGTPGNWEGFSVYLEDPQLRQVFGMVAVDRPGFGDSSLPLMPSLQAQAEALAPLCQEFGPFVAIGHSLGAPLGLVMALELPDCIQAVVSIAGSVTPQYEQPRWFNRLADWPGLSWLIPDALTRANVEVLALPAELRRLESRLDRIEVPVLIIQGGQDRLVVPDSAPWLAERLSASRRVTLRMLPQQGHFVIWDAPELIRRLLLEWIPRD